MAHVVVSRIRRFLNPQLLRRGAAAFLLTVGVFGMGPGAFSQSVPALPASRQAASIPALPSASPSPRSFRYLRPGKAALPAARPGERVLLTLESPGRSLKLTRAQLLALPTMRYTTEQPQLNRTFTYEGVPLRDLARLGGFAGKDLRVYASNGFMVIIRAGDYLNTPIMLAHTAGSKPIPVLQKGPLTIVLPANATQFPARLYSRYWVWYAAKISPAP
ncbi:hypothetical protein SU48_03785 [Deinococcus puniceus]|uniref:Oxidoreductase molybdopterin-binding domain-containing protein n=2 Tax=Deinococcus puniceus TaxID=1182568 RepID=A0A172TCT4_9DEIO|nr:hypothetical protein SU48_03785 [Deinococcus puniceus]